MCKRVNEGRNKREGKALLPLLPHPAVVTHLVNIC